MESYKDFEKVYIGDSDESSLVMRSCREIALLDFASDGTYKAYECFGNDVQIGSHYKKVFSGEYWLKIYDDFGRAYDRYYGGDYPRFDVYRAGAFGCIIHWHD